MSIDHSETSSCVDRRLSLLLVIKSTAVVCFETVTVKDVLDFHASGR